MYVSISFKKKDGNVNPTKAPGFPFFELQRKVHIGIK